MHSLIEFSIEEINVDLIKRRVKSSELFLYPHQFEALRLWHQNRNLLLTTTTGSGKTASVLFPLAEKIGTKNSDHAIFVYPTNALIYNQVKSIIKTFSLIEIYHEREKNTRSIKVAVIPENEKVLDNRLVSPEEADVILYLINSETLEQLVDRRTKGEKLLDLTQFKAKPTIYLTNPDTLYMLLAMRYNQSLRNIAGFGEISTIIIDEFHSYSGIELANIIYSLVYAEELAMNYRKIFLSATPNSELYEIIKRIFDPIEIPTQIEGLKIETSRCLTHKVVVKLYLDSIGNDIVERIKELILYLKQNNDFDSSNPDVGKQMEELISCVVIVDSVVNAIELENKLLEEGIKASSYRGLMNKSARELKGEIIIGTSAIEVGIDFDCKHLIMQGSDVSSFLQRFGRVGRHQQGIAHIFVPSNVIKKFQLLGKKSIPRDEFVEIIHESYPIRDSMTWFVKNRYGLCLAKMLSSNLTNEIRKYRYHNENDVKKALEVEKNFLEKLFLKLQITETIQNVEFIAKSSDWFNALRSKMFFRSSYPTVYVEDMQELQKRPGKLNIYSVDLATLLKRGEPCDFVGMKEGKPVMRINSYKRYLKTYFQSTIDQNNKKLKEGRLYVNKPDIGLYAIRDSIPFSLDRLLLEHVFIIVSESLSDYLDWRTALFTYSIGGIDKLIAFDGDAIICKALLHQLEKDGE